MERGSGYGGSLRGAERQEEGPQGSRRSWGGGWRKSALFNTWKAGFCFPEGTLSLWESGGGGAGESVFYQACDIRQAGSGPGGFLSLSTSTLDACLQSQVTGSCVHPWTPVRITRGAHYTPASQASPLGAQGVSPAGLRGPRMCVLNKHPGGSGAAGWELASEDARINHLKMVPFKVSFALEFALLHGEVNYNNPFYFFKKEKDLALPPFFVWVPFLVGFCVSLQPHKRTQGPLVLCRGALQSPGASSDTVQVAPVQQCPSWKGPVLLQRSLSLPLASRHGSVTSRPGPASFMTQRRAQCHIFLSPVFQLSCEIIF